MIGKDDYYLRIARAISARANCVGRKVGAIVVKGDRILATGYTGTAEGMPNCLDGGCWRRENRSKRTEGDRFRRFTYEDLLQRDKVSLDITWLRDESLEDSDNLAPPNVIAQEIVEGLEAALAEFAQIATALRIAGSEQSGESQQPGFGITDGPA
ncbi:MAG: hypothetical protein ACRDIF_01555 [Actinomycetota bacterium]